MKQYVNLNSSNEYIYIYTRRLLINRVTMYSLNVFVIIEFVYLVDVTKCYLSSYSQIIFKIL